MLGTKTLIRPIGKADKTFTFTFKDSYLPILKPLDIRMAKLKFRPIK